VETGYLKSALVASLAERRRRMESGADVVVGVNRFTETEPSPLTASGAAHVEQVDPAVETAAAESVKVWREQRDADAVAAALGRLRADAATDANLMDATLACVRAGVTTGEWAGALREVFGEYRAPTGLTGAGVLGSSADGVPAPSDGAGEDAVREGLAAVREEVRRTGAELGGRLRLLVGKPGLDGHSNGAEQIAVRARDVGFEVVYQGIRLTPAQLVAAAVAEDVHCVGLSVLSGSHLQLVPAVLDGLRQHGLDDVPVVVGGIIPSEDAGTLCELGVAAVFTPKDYSMTQIMQRIVEEIRRARGLAPLDGAATTPDDMINPGPNSGRSPQEGAARP
jgi:ethylmalonyl-CoA mutase